MEHSSPAILTLLISSGVVAVVLAILAIYWGTLFPKEDDQIFIDAAEQHHYQEQQALITKISRLNTPIITLSEILGLLQLTSAGILRGSQKVLTTFSPDEPGNLTGVPEGISWSKKFAASCFLTAVFFESGLMNELSLENPASRFRASVASTH